MSLGHVLFHDGEHVLVLTRTFAAPLEDVWASVTEPERLARWIGSWTGDPASGSVEFRMLFEGEDPAPEVMEIRLCEPPRRLHLTSRNGDDVWPLELELDHADGVTTLTFRQRGVTRELVGDVGPGWDYYLDRLVDASHGVDPSGRVWDDYLATGAHYTEQASFRA